LKKAEVSVLQKYLPREEQLRLVPSLQEKSFSCNRPMWLVPANTLTAVLLISYLGEKKKHLNYKHLHPHQWY